MNTNKSLFTKSYLWLRLINIEGYSYCYELSFTPRKFSSPVSMGMVRTLFISKRLSWRYSPREEFNGKSSHVWGISGIHVLESERLVKGEIIEPPLSKLLPKQNGVALSLLRTCPKGNSLVKLLRGWANSLIPMSPHWHETILFSKLNEMVTNHACLQVQKPGWKTFLELIQSNLSIDKVQL